MISMSLVYDQQANPRIACSACHLGHLLLDHPSIGLYNTISPSTSWAAQAKGTLLDPGIHGIKLRLRGVLRLGSFSAHMSVNRETGSDYRDHFTTQMSVK